MLLLVGVLFIVPGMITWRIVMHFFRKEKQRIIKTLGIWFLNSMIIHMVSYSVYYIWNNNMGIESFFPQMTDDVYHTIYNSFFVTKYALLSVVISVVLSIMIIYYKRRIKRKD